MEPVWSAMREIVGFTIPRLSGNGDCGGPSSMSVHELATTAGPIWMTVHEILLAESGDRVARAFAQSDLDGPLDRLAA